MHLPVRRCRLDTLDHVLGSAIRAPEWFSHRWLVRTSRAQARQSTPALHQAQSPRTYTQTRPFMASTPLLRKRAAGDRPAALRIGRPGMQSPDNITVCLADGQKVHRLRWQVLLEGPARAQETASSSRRSPQWTRDMTRARSEKEKSASCASTKAARAY